MHSSPQQEGKRWQCQGRLNGAFPFSFLLVAHDTLKCILYSPHTTKTPSPSPSPSHLGPLVPPPSRFPHLHIQTQWLRLSAQSKSLPIKTRMRTNWGSMGLSALSFSRTSLSLFTTTRYARCLVTSSPIGALAKHAKHFPLTYVRPPTSPI